MNEVEQNSQKQGKRIIKKYILHQKVNPRLLGVELLNKHLATPHEAYLSCKLIFKKDVQSLMELEEIAKKIYETWTEKNNELLIKKINIFTSAAYIVLTFTIGFYEEAQVKHLRKLKEHAKELIESYDTLIKQEKEAEYKRKEKEIYEVFDQLTKKMDGLEERLTKNETIVLDSGELLKTELTKVSQTIKEQMGQAEQSIKEVSSDSPKKELGTTKIKQKKSVRKEQSHIRKYTLDRSKQLKSTLKIKNWTSNYFPLKNINRREPIKKNDFKEYVSNLELEVLTCFTENKELKKKRMVPIKQFLILKAKVEFIDYLWMLLELEGREEIIIAGKLSCRKLIKELGQFMETVEKVAVGPTIFNYWVFCSQEILIKMEGYAALKDFLSSSLRLSNSTLVKEA
ncbi:hypothetical protein UAW_01970 [Enterococcus haemoperoxidus ATCC BAA-382]|uniref:Uncharacterized protein n=1 Tax=Enterococcus haemoperoxidus ATCC BAA-382 TaxID=1158608 RepID=R2SS36_9ENTE|nr:hypothetical protein [Enterococcus haemoperoxidus]EOH95621.1 hypothetical protein UAW_01970 [Enterococcus haemoperoxidus ATCC BAA-382]EOT60300.1 hypothetical protein I583_02935 [Enterococcus haemoperoxidus ATCC BAA-382]OJG53292.1 hypothetical protein RV06_GL000696 [Enterococcus haemoperoxidus]